MQTQQAIVKPVGNAALLHEADSRSAIFGQQRMIRGAQLWRTKRGEGVTGMSKTWVYQMIRDGNFPAPVRLSAHSSAWTAESIAAWLAACHLCAGVKQS